MGSSPIPGANQSIKGRDVMEKFVKFPVTALFTTDVPEDVNYWERRAFSNPLSAKEFAKIIKDSSIGEHISKIIFASYGGWIILGMGMKIPRHKFTAEHDQYYYELCKKVGGVSLEGIEDFQEFLMSDWVPEMNMVVFGDSVDILFQTSIESNKLSSIKLRLREASATSKNEMFSQVLEKIENKYLSLSPIYHKASDIFEVMKLCDSVLDNCVRQLHLREVGTIGRKTMGVLVSEIEDKTDIPKHLVLKLRRILYYRNKIEHYDLIDPSEYKLEMQDLEVMLTDMLDVLEYLETHKF